MAIMDAKDLASYIKYKYNRDFHKKISHLKLQKSLYFCFAYWGGFIRNGKNNSDMSEIDVSKQDEILYDNRIEAWVYGPVVPDVYGVQDELVENKDFPVADELVKDYIDGILDSVLGVSDFKLVEESHNDDAWKDNFDNNDKIHKNEIIKEKIINEYACKSICG